MLVISEIQEVYRIDILSIINFSFIALNIYLACRFILSIKAVEKHYREKLNNSKDGNT